VLVIEPNAEFRDSFRVHTGFKVIIALVKNKHRFYGCVDVWDEVLAS